MNKDLEKEQIIKNFSSEELLRELEQRNCLPQKTNFWEECPQKTKSDILDLLTDKLGKPNNELAINCINALTKKILYFYSEEKDTRGQDVSSLIGQVAEITLKKFKEGKRMGQIYYSLKLENKTILRASKEDLPAEKWTQIEKLEVLNQNLVFKYRKWIIHKDIIDFYPVETEPTPQPEPSQN